MIIVSVLTKGVIFIENKDNEIIILDNTIRRYVDNLLMFNSRDKYKMYFFYTLFRDNSGTIWLGDKKGLYTLEKDSIIQNTIIPNAPVKAMNQLKNNTLLIGVDNYGLFFLNPDKPTKTLDFIPLKEYSINDIYIDEDTDIWISTENGLIKIQYQNPNHYDIQEITTFNGLGSNQVKKTISINDTMYIASNNGISVFEKSKLKRNMIAPKLIYDYVKVNEKIVSIDSMNHLNHFENTIEFWYTGLAYRSTDQTQYAYRLSGVDSTWQYTYLRHVKYHSLSPGKYTFSIKCANEDGIWSNVLTTPFTITVPFWKTRWFISFVLGIIALTTYFVFKYKEKINQINLKRVKQIELQKRKIVEAELTALRAQMNPHFTFNTLNSIQSYILTSSIDNALDYIEQFSKLLRNILETSKYQFITLEKEIYILDIYLSLENMRLNNSLEYTFNIAGDINPEHLKIPSMILQPIIENAIVHGLAPKKIGKKKIELTVVKNRSQIICSIRDNGIGREASEAVKHAKQLDHEPYGIRIIKERLKLIYNNMEPLFSLNIKDLYDQNHHSEGTLVTIYFPINNNNIYP